MPDTRKSKNTTLKQLHSIGLTQKEIESQLITDEPKVPNYICLPKSDKNPDCYGQGFDLNENKARIKSVAECLERICLFNPESDLFIYQKFLGQPDFVNPLDFLSYSDKQINRNSHEANIRREKLSWWPALNGLNGSQVFVPAQLLFLSSHFDDEFPIKRERISTGSAFGMIGQSRALYSGFFEVIERDAVMGAYLMKKSLPKIMNMPDEAKELIDYYNRYNLEVHILNATTDLGIPVAISLVLDRSGIGEAVNLGAKSGRNYLECIVGSLFEAVQPRRAARMAQILTPEIFKFDESQPIRNMEERYAYWRSTKRIKHLDFWLNSSLETDYNEISSIDMSLKKAFEIMKARAYSVYISDITSKQIKYAGFETLKVLIPALHPLYLAENAKALYSIHYGKIKENPTLKPHPFT